MDELPLALPIIGNEADRSSMAPPGSPCEGARQESDESCGPLFRSAFPEVLKATTQLGTAESDDGVGALNGPVHSGSFEPCADGYLAPGLHHAGGSTPALRMELRIAHAVSVGLEIVEATTSVLGAAHLA